MPSWTAEEIVRVLLAAGFVRLPQGATSHVKLRHPDGRTTVVSMHRGDIRPGTLAAIRRETRLDFRKLGATMARLFYPAILEAASDGFCVFFPDFDGCTSGGDDATQAALNAEEALALFLEDWTKPLPQPSPLDVALDPEAEPAYRILVPYKSALVPA